MGRIAIFIDNIGKSLPTSVPVNLTDISTLEFLYIKMKNGMEEEEGDEFPHILPALSVTISK